ncbi:MAG: hypothetical protein WAO35_07930 [Terriglobia bacterium]
MGGADAGVVLNRGWWVTGEIGDVATANSSWELTVGLSSEEKPTVAGDRRRDTIGTRWRISHVA